MEERVRLELLRELMGRLREMEDDYWMNVPHWIRAEEERRARDGGVWRVEEWEVRKGEVIAREWGGILPPER